MTALSNDELKTLLLDHYHCTFFLPLLGFGQGLAPKADLKKIYPLDKELSEADAEAFYYFTPTLRDIVFDRGIPNESGLQAIQEWHLSADTLKDWRLELLPSPEQKEDAGDDEMKLALVHQKVEFQSVRLYRYFNGIYMLAFTVKPHATQHMYLEAWLRFTRLGRQLYPTFTEQRNEGKIAPLEFTAPKLTEPLRALDKEVSRHFPKSSEYLSPLLIHLVQQFFADDIKQKLKDEIRLFDDRMFVSVAYGLAGEEKLAEDKRNRIKALIATTDRFADTWSEMDDYAYSQTAIDRIMQNTEFDFWADIGGHFIYNDMVNGYLYNGWFFCNIIAPKHIPYIYDRMLIQALFYQASLRHYNHQITETTKALLDDQEKTEVIKKQREDFIRFTNQYWFPELTNQMQGKETFRLQQRGLGLQADYERIKEQITRTDEYLHAQREARNSKLSNRLTSWGAGFALGALYLATLPILKDVQITDITDAPALDAPIKTSLWQWLEQQMAWPWLAIVVGLPVLISLAALGIWCIRKLWRWLKPPQV